MFGFLLDKCSNILCFDEKGDGRGYREKIGYAMAIEKCELNYSDPPKTTRPIYIKFKFYHFRGSEKISFVFTEYVCVVSCITTETTIAEKTSSTVKSNRFL